MQITRRNLLGNVAKSAAAAVAAGSVSAVALTDVVHGEEEKVATVKAVGMLYDATRCVGCQSCVVACVQANNPAPDARLDSLHQAPRDLTDHNRNIIKLYTPTDGEKPSFVKQQCMHCVDPACTAACMFKGLKKDETTGIVTWTGSLCVGCRYCEIACPYHIPKFQWNGFNPKIVKCELCKDRLAVGKEPACTTVCPTHAVIFGTRTELLAEAKRRIAQNPGRYYQDHIFGEEEGGGTQVLYLSAVPFDKLGLPKIGNESVPGKYLKWQKRLYSYLLLPGALYLTLATFTRKSWKHHEEHLKHDEKETGLRPQL
jgi:Fe-S-cluster-containing dehydrogenase component